MQRATTRGSQRALLAVLAAGALGVVSPSYAATITLSNASSDSSVDAVDLSATMDFEIDATTLTLSVSNDSTSFDILSFFFNAAPSVSGLSLTSGPADWKLDSLASNGNPTKADLFGTFDYVVWVKGKAAKNSKLLPGDSAIFVFDITGAGPFSASDFVNTASAIQAGEIATLVAARFDNSNASPFGAVHAPEPSTGLLVGMGTCVLAAKRRRQRARRAS